MPRWLTSALTRIQELASARRIRFTLKARQELASLKLGVDEEDVCDVLESLTEVDSAGRLASTTGEWMYLFKPVLAGLMLYVKVILRTDCVVLSFHEDEGGGDEEDDA